MIKQQSIRDGIHIMVPESGPAGSSSLEGIHLAASPHCLDMEVAVEAGQGHGSAAPSFEPGAELQPSPSPLSSLLASYFPPVSPFSFSEAQRWIHA